MAKIRVLGESPPPPRGNSEEQLRDLRDYLTRLKDELEFLLTHLGEDNFSESLATWVTDTGKSIDNINTVLDGKDDADRFMVVDTGNLTLADQTWTTWSGGNVYGILMLAKPDGYHPISACISTFSNWVQGADLIPMILESNGNTYLLSEVDSTTLGSSAKAGLRIVLEKDS